MSSLFFSIFLSCSFAFRLSFLNATLHSSPTFLTCFERLFLLSSLGTGNVNLIILPSLEGFKPKSDVSIEFMKLAGCLVGEKYDAPFRVKDLFKGVEPRKQDINRDLFYNAVFTE